MPQLDYTPVMGRQLQDRPANLISGLRALQMALGFLADCRRRLVSLFVKFVTFGLLFLYVVQTNVIRYSTYPGSKRSLHIESFQSFKGTYEGILRQILGLHSFA